MSQRTPTLWNPNPAKAGGIAYSSPSTQYNAAAVAYSSASAGVAVSGKVAVSWAARVKTPTRFVPNSAAIINLYLYDSSSKMFDSAVDTYDGVVSGQEFGDIKTPTAWSSL